jgi:hypothetical protein
MMGVVSKIRNEVEDLKLAGHHSDAVVSSDRIRIMELLERQATIIEILGEMNPEHLKRFVVESYNP